MIEIGTYLVPFPDTLLFVLNMSTRDLNCKISVFFYKGGQEILWNSALLWIKPSAENVLEVDSCKRSDSIAHINVTKQHNLLQK